MKKLPIAVGLVLALILSTGLASGTGVAVEVGTWGGGYAAALEKQMLDRFSVLGNRATVKVVRGLDRDSGGDFERVDVLDLELAETVALCEQGQLHFLPARHERGGQFRQKYAQDFLPGALQPCGVGHTVWSTVIVYRSDTWEESERPTALSDFFDTTHFPGKRAIRKSPQNIAEWSLYNAGVASSDVYAALADTEHVWSLMSRALSNLDSHLIWVDNDQQALELLRSGIVDFAMLDTDKVVQSPSKSIAYGVIWDGAITKINFWSIPVTATSFEKSWEFVQFASAPENTGRFSTALGYSPARISALRSLPREYQELMPAHSKNNKSLILRNSLWWRQSGSMLTKKFAHWLSRSASLASSDGYFGNRQLIQRRAPVSKGVRESGTRGDQIGDENLRASNLGAFGVLGVSLKP